MDRQSAQFPQKKSLVNISIFVGLLISVCINELTSIPFSLQNLTWHMQVSFLSQQHNTKHYAPRAKLTRNFRPHVSDAKSIEIVLTLTAMGASCWVEMRNPSRHHYCKDYGERWRSPLSVSLPLSLWSASSKIEPQPLSITAHINPPQLRI